MLLPINRPDNSLVQVVFAFGWFFHKWKKHMELNKSYWFVGALWGGTDNQLPRFLEEGIWENGYNDRYLDKVRSMQVGERIAIKSSYVRKGELPFDGKGHSVSVMAIKAIGTITENFNDGKKIRVTWEKVEPNREWYFYTHRGTIWQVKPDNWMAVNLISFTFDEVDQNVSRFRNDPFWAERFGDTPLDQQKFKWTQFYEAIADALLKFKSRRLELSAKLVEIASGFGLSYLLDKQLVDVCPFTVMGIFNRGITDSRRKLIAKKLADFLEVTIPVPETFEGIPILNNQKSWFFGAEADRHSSDIDSLWDFFEKAIEFADSGEQDSRTEFMAAYNRVTNQFLIGWNITMALYWIRPWSFLTLDEQSRSYIDTKLRLSIGKNGAKGRSSDSDYMKLVDELELLFQQNSYPVHSFPALSYAAFLSPSENIMPTGWRHSLISKIQKICQDKNDNIFTRQEFLSAYLEVLKNEFPNNNTHENTINRVFQTLRDDDLLEFLEKGRYKWLGELVLNDFVVDASELNISKYPAYSVQNIIDDGCFLDASELEAFISRLKSKKNIILQGPPGTGKTWLAKKLAFALIGHKDEAKLTVVQFHPNLSYEDFVRGYRPSTNGKLDVVDGVFLETIKSAINSPASKFVVVIEEINRGNPAQIFGELLTLIEAGKRTPSEAIQLTYPDQDGIRRPVHVPENLYIIGTMNVADRSLALVDLALRRRFAFISLEPTLGEKWRNWVTEKCGLDLALVELIESRFELLNKKINDDARLGKQFRIGHSYVTPTLKLDTLDTKKWFEDVVRTEIEPLLEEYWFDSPLDVKDACDKLLESM